MTATLLIKRETKTLLKWTVYYVYREKRKHKGTLEN